MFALKSKHVKNLYLQQFLQNTWKKPKPEIIDVAYTEMNQDGCATKQNNYKAGDLESF